jgi:hypothetical protein
MRILPENPDREDILSPTIQSQDKDRDIITYLYQWLRNDEEMSGENQATLKCINFQKGDLIRVKVTPSDGKVEGEPFLSSPVKILNSPPKIQELWIEPKVAYANDNLKVSIKCLDVDGDSINYTYQWKRNGINLNGDKEAILEQGQFKKRDLITVLVTPDDGETSGTPRKSDPITIANSPPIIISSPPTKTNDNIYTYQIKANDPDNDSIIFNLKSAPKGMEINKDTGLIQWGIRTGDKGTHTIEIEASDSDGSKCYQRYNLTIEFR